MNTSNPLAIVRHFATTIQNGRELQDIHDHAAREMVELQEELTAEKNPDLLHVGDDGVVGEAIDVVACMLDLIFVHSPHITDDEINERLLAKCQKWARRYKDSVEGDRSID